MAAARLALVLLAGCGAAPASSVAAPTVPPDAGAVATSRVDSTDLGEGVRVGPNVILGGTVVAAGSVESYEEKALEALRRCLGQTAQSGAPPLSASAAVVALRATSVQLRVEPNPGSGSGHVDPLLVVLQDSFTDRATVLQRKVVEQTATPAEAAELQEGTKQLFRLTDLRMALLDVSVAAMLSNAKAHELARQNAAAAKSVVGLRPVTAADTERDRALIAKQKRAYVVLAATTSLLAAFEAVINRGKDPKSLDVIAQGALQAFPLRITVSDRERLGDGARNDAPNPADAFARRDLKGTFDAAIPLAAAHPPLRDALVAGRALLEAPARRP